ncbi:MAG: glucosaminidase domain-containing protein [Bacteroidaceae bacterium]|nr:glucosaminidase domain-containing protein [Bacteroidaceae bacterium]
MKKTLLYIALSVLSVFALPAMAQNRQNQTYLNYIHQYKDMAIKEMEKYHIPASITLAQGLLESGAGRSDLATKGNNHFGIKCGGGWTGRRMYKDDDQKNDCFRVYGNAKDSYEDHSRFLLRDRYKRLFNLKITDYKGWAKGLKECGYATSPTYATRLINIIETYELYQYDKGGKGNHGGYHDEIYDIATTTTTITDSQPAGKHTYTVNNGVVCVVALPGDTWQSLSKSLHKSRRRLLKYNEAVVTDPIQPGTFIYLHKKQKKADRKYRKYWHKVQPGESMYSIAQLYGIRIKYLYKKNFKSAAYSPQPGDLLKVR